uniref:Uncharacterized protein n=1 Tax=Neolamprologus brichardi TaxID=32507 RepID=A0A3Q4G2W8_NEOBR
MCFFLLSGGAVVSAPIVLGAVGFTSVGIAAGSYAASWMSAAAIANGGGVAAGSAVAVLQSAVQLGVSSAGRPATRSIGSVISRPRSIMFGVSPVELCLVAR